MIKGAEEWSMTTVQLMVGPYCGPSVSADGQHAKGPAVGFDQGDMGSVLPERNAVFLELLPKPGCGARWRKEQRRIALRGCDLQLREHKL